VTRTEGAAVSLDLTASAYERIVAKHRLEQRRRCACNYDGTPCALEPLHTDWHKDTRGRRWP
jgi:hypothetical protein